MTVLLVAAALATSNMAPKAASKDYGVLLLAYDVDQAWRKELANIGQQMNGLAVETVFNAPDATSIQRALERLERQHVKKIVAVPLETISNSPKFDQTKYLFGQRDEPVHDQSDAANDPSNTPTKVLKPVKKSSLQIARSGILPLHSTVPLLLSETLEQSPLLIEILADRAKALSRTPAKEALVLAGIGPRSDKSLKAWKESAQAIANKVGAKAGFHKAVALALRDGVRAAQQDKDRQELRQLFHSLGQEGRINVISLAPESKRVDELLRKNLGQMVAYRWDGRGLQGDHRLVEWINLSAQAASNLPESKQFNRAQARVFPGGIK